MFNSQLSYVIEGTLHSRSADRLRILEITNCVPDLCLTPNSVEFRTVHKAVGDIASSVDRRNPRLNLLHI